MKGTELISITESYVKEVMGRQAPAMAVAHDFKHVDRVRNWALVLASEEGYQDLLAVEITALLHDVGFGCLSGPDAERPHVVLPPHGPLGAEMAGDFLKENSGFAHQIIEAITDAIRHHSDAPWVVEEYVKGLKDGGALLKILRDADEIDAMGAVGLMRAMTSRAFLQEYDPARIKGPAWGLSTQEFRARLGAEPGSKQVLVQTIVDQVNQQIRYYDGLHTPSARRLAAPFAEFMKLFVLQLEAEITMPVRAAGNGRSK